MSRGKYPCDDATVTPAQAEKPTLSPIAQAMKARAIKAFDSHVMKFRPYGLGTWVSVGPYDLLRDAQSFPLLSFLTIAKGAVNIFPHPLGLQLEQDPSIHRTKLLQIESE